MRAGLAKLLLDHNLSLSKLGFDQLQISGNSRPQVLISGSAVVQAALGTSWDSDVDIFCTWAAAPKVRARLMTASPTYPHGGGLVFGHANEGGYEAGQ